MAPDVTRVTVLGGGKRKVATKDRRGAVTERYDVRWRVQLRSGETRMFRQRFDRPVDADGLVRRLQASGERLAPRRRRRPERKAGVGQLAGRGTDGVGRPAARPVGDVAWCVGQRAQGGGAHTANDGEAAEAQRSARSPRGARLPRPPGTGLQGEHARRLRRIFDAGRLSWAAYRTAYLDERDRVLGFAASPGGSGGNFYNTTPVRVSKRFARALIVSTWEGQTLYREAARLLGFKKLATLDELGHSLGIG